MSTLILISPLALSATISVWLGFKIRMILFGAWLSACVAVTVLLMQSAFGDIAFSQSGLNLLMILIVLQVACFGIGLLMVRTRNARNAK